MQLALLHPQVVRKLVVVDIAPRAYSPRHERIIAAMLSLDLSRFQNRRDMEAALAPAVPDLATRQFLLKNIVRVEGAGFRWLLGLEQIRDNYARLTQPVQGGTPFDKPALFIRGSHSDFLVEADFPLIERLFPRARFATVPQAGHLVHVQSPELFVRLVEDFLVGS